MKPGRELDALIAEKVMGLKKVHTWPRLTEKSSVDLTCLDTAQEPVHWDGPTLKVVPPYSTIMGATTAVLEKFDTYSLTKAITIKEEGGPLVEWFTAHVTKFEPERFAFETSFVSASHAICLAALKAMD